MKAEEKHNIEEKRQAMASFRVNQAEWEEFKQRCKQRKVRHAEMLRLFIKKELVD